MPRDKRDVEAGLRNKGFVQDNNDHHFFVYWTLDGRKTRARTKTSHTQRYKDIGDGLLAEMARQCKLTKPQFLSLIDCPMAREQYEAALTERGELTPRQSNSR